MLLAIDVGNTQTVIGVFDDAGAVDGVRTPGEMPGLVEHWRVSTQGDRTADEHALLLQELCAWSGLAFAPRPEAADAGSNGVISGIAVSSSVPMITAALREMGGRWPEVPLVVVEPGIKTGMPILYDNPKEVGADRIVNAVGAFDLFGGPAIVVDLGTATTFDAISAGGEYVGGAIAPGLEISMDALFAQAAALRRVELVAPGVAIGRSTVESMQVGAVYGHAALVDGLCRRIEAELGTATIVATGGLGALIAPHSSAIVHYEPWLTLHGLRLLFAHNIDADTVPGTMSEPVPYRFPDTVGAGTITAAHGGLGPGEESGEIVTVAGRVMRNRPQGRLAFAELRDWSGSIQLFALAATTARFEEFTRLNLGDWVGATGEVIRTKRGELSVRVASFELLAEARRGFGDKWRGVHDVEVRHRQREVDLWANEGVRDGFLARSRAIAAIRRHLDDLGFVEVETPVLHPIVGGANARPFATHFNALHADFYLRIATELYLKRLVVGGFERVYEIGKAFRNEGLSPRHNPEYTLLEAYQVYADYLDMAELIEQIVAGAAHAVVGSTVLEYQGRPLDLTPPWRRATLEEVVAEVTGTECRLEMGVTELARRAAALGLELAPGLDAAELLAEIYEKTTEHELWDPVHVMDYPAAVSPLARAHRSRPGFAERLTPVAAGRELAEAYSELVDPAVQRAHFTAQAARRAAGDEEAMPMDEDFLRALEHGMPPTGGIGIGVDRLMMLLSDVSNIRDVLLFPALRPEADGGKAGDEARPERQP